VITVAVGGVDGDQVLAGGFDPVTDLADLLVGVGRIDEHGVALAGGEEARPGGRRG
jgi:hypothetical protein